MIEYFVFWLKQTKTPGKPIGQIRIKKLTGDEGEKFSTILIDDIRSENIDKKIGMLIEELKKIQKLAKKEFTKGIPR